MTNINDHSIYLLENYLKNLDTNWWKSSFYILSWPKDIWKTELLVNLAKKELWDFYLNDFLYIKDFSKYLWKEHELKIEYKDDNPVSKELLQEYDYEDLWVREITQWLSKSFAWTKKILLIENIERMNKSAMNAFLKTCEEPFPNRIILATTSNKSRLLDTVLSRAIVIPFFEWSYEDLLSRCEEMWYFVWENELKSFVSCMCMGKIWTLDYLHERISWDDELKNVFKQIIDILESGTIWVQYKSLLYIANNWLVEPFLDWLIWYYILNNKFDDAEKWLNVRKYLWTNVKVDHLLFSGLI